MIYENAGVNKLLSEKFHGTVLGCTFAVPIKQTVLKKHSGIKYFTQLI
jgi:hypothetical protein